MLRKMALGCMLFASTSAFSQSFSVVSECQPEDYVELEDGATIEITGLGYTPRCATIQAGSTITIEATDRHGLWGMEAIEGNENPFLADVWWIEDVTRTLDAPGFYGYYCREHGSASGQGMAGSIQVVN